jgi:hypothetical protein
MGSRLEHCICKEQLPVRTATRRTHSNQSRRRQLPRQGGQERKPVQTGGCTVIEVGIPGRSTSLKPLFLCDPFRHLAKHTVVNFVREIH